jgi:tetratricopeptide (TPR) repeat protein
VLSELARDPWLNVVTPSALNLLLPLAGYDPKDLPRDTLLKIAKLFRTNAYVDLTVSRVTAGYVFSVDARGSLSDNSIGISSAAANSAADVPQAIQRVAIDLRRALVRSRRALPATPMVGLVTDVASVAIPPFLEAQSDFDRRRYFEAAAKAREATQLDSTFAMAWRLRFVALANAAGAPNSARAEAIATAYRLRDRIKSPIDRANVSANYLSFVGRDDEAAAAFDDIARRAPAVPGMFMNQGLAYSRMRRLDVAARIYRGSIDTTYSRLFTANTSLVGELLKLGRVEDAMAEYRRMLTHADSNDVTVRATRYTIATATRDWSSIDALAKSEFAQRGQTARIRSLQYSRTTAAVQGRIARLDSLNRLRADEFNTNNSPSTVLGEYLNSARMHGSAGDTAGARRLIQEGLSKAPWTSLDPLDRPFSSMIIALALVTDTTRADAIAADWSKSVPSEYKLQDSLDVLTARAEVALARRNPQEALRLLRLSDVRGCASCFYPRYARVYDAMRRPDSVTAYYERYVAATQPGATGDGYELARAYRRLGEIYEERRDWKRAVQRYQDFVDLWEHADPMLQPAVKDVRARIERIRAKAG